MYYVKLFLLIFVSIQFCNEIVTAQIDDDDNCYVAEFRDEIKDCDGFENKKIKSSLSLAISQSNNAEGELILSGDLELTEDIDEQYEIEINVWKDLGTGKQFMYRADGNFCDSVHRNDTPWRALVEALKATKCPIVKGVYPVNDLAMSLDFAKSVLCREFCGDYIAELVILTSQEQISCHKISIGIEEVPCE